MTVPGFLHPFARPAADQSQFIRIVRGEGALVWDDAGREYIDALASLWYCAIGHGRREVIDAVTSQMHQLEAFHTFDRFTNAPADALCEELVGLAPMPDSRVFLTSGGSESVDTAIKLARRAHAVAGAPERTVIISRTPSYHGVTFGATSATGLPLNREGWGPLVPDIVQVPHDSLPAMEAVFAAHPDGVAAVLAEPVIGAGGIIPPVDGYLAGLRELCDRYGAYLILDEVICAFGRLGTWWGAQRFGVQPDLVTFAKAITSGYLPLGGVLVGRRVRQALEADETFILRHGYTYSGHPTACAAGLAVLDVMRKEGLLERAAMIEERLSTGLAGLVAAGLLAGDRGAGAMRAAILPPGRDAVVVRDDMLAGGVIARPIGADVIAFCPPLVIDEAGVDRCVEALEDALKR
jgi:adenosylmethionine-8-amino-7-oxononanoate aminotransferase